MIILQIKIYSVFLSEGGVCMKSIGGIFCFISIPILLFFVTRGEPAWCLISFEVNIFLAMVMFGLGCLIAKQNKRERQALYTIGLYYSLSTVAFFYCLLPIFMEEGVRYRAIIVCVVEILLASFCNLWGFCRMR